MVFCGQCGLLIPPGSVQCPRCGTPVETSSAPQQADTSDANAETQASMHALPQRPGGDYPSAHTERTQQYDTSHTSTRLNQSSTRQTGAYPPPVPHTSNPYNPINASQVPYGSGTGFQPQSGYNNYYNAPPSNASYLGYQGQPPTTPPPRRNNALLVSLIIVTLVVVLLTISVFAVGPDKFFPSSTANQTATVTTQSGETATPTNTPEETTTPEATDTPEETATAQPTDTPQTTPTPNVSDYEARNLVQNYYNYINAKQYEQAYALFANPTQTYQEFKDGFATTDHDTITESNTSPDPNGVKVTITMQATTTDNQASTYNGYYIVTRQSDGSLKFSSSQINKVS